MWSASLRDNVPLWGNSYTVEGVLQLPYAELKEPFTAYYDATTNQSRIDYYGGRSSEKPSEHYIVYSEFCLLLIKLIAINYIMPFLCDI